MLVQRVISFGLALTLLFAGGGLTSPTAQAAEMQERAQALLELRRLAEAEAVVAQARPSRSSRADLLLIVFTFCAVTVFAGLAFWWLAVRRKRSHRLVPDRNESLRSGGPNHLDGHADIAALRTLAERNPGEVASVLRAWTMR